MKRKTKKTNTRSDVIYAIALAGISAAVSLFLVWLGVVVRFSTIAFFVAAGIALMTPVYKKFYLSSFFAFAVSASISFAITGDIVAVIGYIIYFGPMSILTAIFAEKKVKWFITYPIKLIYINGAIALLYFAFGTLVIDGSVLGEIHYAVIAVVGTIGLLLIDLVMQLVYKYIVPRVGKAIKGRTVKKDGESTADGVDNGHGGSCGDENCDGKNNPSNDDTETIDGDNPFEDM